MCVIEERTYVNEDGTRQIVERPRFCRHSHKGRCCSRTTRTSAANYADPTSPGSLPALSVGASTSDSTDPVTPQGPFNSGEDDDRGSTRYIKPEIIIDFGKKGEKKYKRSSLGAISIPSSPRSESHPIRTGFPEGPFPPVPWQHGYTGPEARAPEISDRDADREHRRHHHAEDLRTQEEAKRRREEADSTMAEQLAAEEARQARFETGRAQGRAEWRAETASSEKDRHRFLDKKEQRRKKEEAAARLEKEKQDQARAAKRQEENDRLAEETQSKTTRDKSSKHTKKYSEELEQQRQYELMQTQAQIAREREAAEQREQEDRAVELRRRRQPSSFWDPRGGSRYAPSSETSSMTRRDSVSASSRPQFAGLDRRVSIHQSQPPKAPYLKDTTLSLRQRGEEVIAAEQARQKAGDRGWQATRGLSREINRDESPEDRIAGFGPKPGFWKRVVHGGEESVVYEYNIPSERLEGEGRDAKIDHQQQRSAYRGYRLDDILDNTGNLGDSSTKASTHANPQGTSAYDFHASFARISTGARAWAQYALSRPPETASTVAQLDSLLEQYAIRQSYTGRLIEQYSQNAPPSVTLSARRRQGAATLIQVCGTEIAHYFRTNACTEPATTGTLAHRFPNLDRDIILLETVDSFTKADRAWRHGLERTAEGEHRLPDDNVPEVLASLQKLLVSNTAFSRLADAMTRTFYHDDRASMERIEQTLGEAISREGRPTINGEGALIYSAKFDIFWDVKGVLRSQFGEEVPQLATLVALTGSALFAEASTCADYAIRTWPRLGRLFLDKLQNALDGAGGTDHTISDAPLNRLEIELEASVRRSPKKRITVIAQGTEELLLDLAQQMSWLGAALVPSPSEEELTYAQAKIQDVSTKLGVQLSITFECQPLHPTENACWLPLFHGASIARGFPIEKRAGETGLEIPLSMIAAIAGARHAVEYEGGVVMKGFSSVFVPISRQGNRVQWHLISNSNCENRLSYQDALQQCKNRAMLDEVTLDSLPNTRAIVGWCSNVLSLLGSETVNYENIDYSGAGNANSPLKVSGGTLGIQQFAVAQVDFTLAPNHGKCHFPRQGLYKRIIRVADQTHIVLYDTLERRAWLVSACEVMLHIAHHRNSLDHFEINGKRLKMPTRGSSQALAREVLLQNAHFDLSDDEKYTFGDMIRDTWSLLETLMDQNVYNDKSPGITVKGTLRDVLYGFEFKAVVEERSPCPPKQTIIEKTSGGWATLVRDQSALVLFASGFEDLMRPSMEQSTAVCKRWRTVPKGKDYLATSVKTLTDLYDVAGSRLSREFLTSTHLQWHRPRNTPLFECCSTADNIQCRCDRLQQILPASAIGRINPPGLLHDTGAVIFGQSVSSFRSERSLRMNGSSKAPASIYSQPNISLNSNTAYAQTELLDSPSSDVELSGNSNSDITDGSDATECTAASSIASSTTLQSLATTITGLTLDSDSYVPKKSNSFKDDSVDTGKPCSTDPCVAPPTRRNILDSLPAPSAPRLISTRLGVEDSASV